MEFALASRTGGVPRVLDRRISNAGRVSDIRQRDPQQIFTTGGIPKYSMLGSQNAISYVPIAYLSKDTGTQTDKEKKDAGTDAGTDARPLLGTTQSEASKKAMKERASEGLLGTTQSEASKTAMGVRKILEEDKARTKEEEEKARAERESAVEPSEKPPYDLSSPEGKKALDDYEEYVMKRYGKDAGKLKADETKVDSEGFTATLNAWRSINKEITAFNRDDARRWGEWANNTFKKYGDQIIDVLSIGAGTLYPGSKALITEVSQLVKQFKPSDEKDFVGSMKQLQAKLFEGRPEWKKKVNEIVKISWDKWINTIGKELGFDTRDSDRMFMSGKKKEAPAEEPKAEPKKRKLRKSVPMKI